MYLRFRNGVTTSQTPSSLWPKRWLRYLKNKSGVIGRILPSLRSKLYECQNRWHTQNDTMCHLINIHLRPAWTFPCRKHIRWNLVIFLILWFPKLAYNWFRLETFCAGHVRGSFFRNLSVTFWSPMRAAVSFYPVVIVNGPSLAIQTGLEVGESKIAEDEGVPWTEGSKTDPYLWWIVCCWKLCPGVDHWEVSVPSPRPLTRKVVETAENPNGSVQRIFAFHTGWSTCEEAEFGDCRARGS